MKDFDRLPVLIGINEPGKHGEHAGVKNRLNYGNITILLLFLLLAFQPSGTGTAAAMPEDVETPAEVHIPLLLKSLSFDRNLKNRAGNEIVLGIVYQEKFRKSLNIKHSIEDFLSTSSTTTIEDVPFRYVSIALSSLPKLKTTLEKEKVDIVYITPLRAVSVESLVSISRSLRIASFTGVPEYCDAGVAVSIGLKGGSPSIIVNLAAARSEGMDFSSRFLKLVRVINK